MDTVLGLDLGTTNCKAVLFDRDGQLVASAKIPTPVRGEAPPAPGSPEFDAQALWDACARLIRRVTGQLPSGQAVVGVAVASMGEAGVLVDEAGGPLMSILIWHDRRTFPWIDWWRTRISQPDIYRITGLPLDHIYSANKLLYSRCVSQAVSGPKRTSSLVEIWRELAFSRKLRRNTLCYEC
jgi:xylulokinase